MAIGKDFRCTGGESFCCAALKTPDPHRSTPRMSRRVKCKKNTCRPRYATEVCARDTPMTEKQVEFEHGGTAYSDISDHHSRVSLMNLPKETRA
jgi:hypothetical protein